MQHKFLTRMVAITLGLAMAVGVGVGVANNRNAKPVYATTGSYTFTYDLNTNNSGTGTSCAEDSSTEFTAAKFKSSGTNTYSVNKTTYYWIHNGYSDISTVDLIANVYPGKNHSLKVGKAKGDGTLNFTVAGAANLYITSVEITAWGSGNTAKIIIDEATEATKSWTLDTTSGSHTFTYDSEVKTVSITGGAGLTSSNKVAYITEMVINYSISSTPVVTTSSESLFFRTGGTNQTVTATPSNFSGAASYSWAYQSGTDCVDLTNANSATVTMTPKNSITEYSTGVYRVTATYSTESAHADVTVAVDNGGSVHPYSIAEARAAIDAGRGLENAYVKGVVYQVDSYNSTYHSITYWISDDGTNTVPFEVYGGLAIEGQPDFTSKDDIALGDIVVVKGTIKKHSSTYEFDKDNRLISQISVASIAVKTAPTKVAYNSSEFFDPTGLVVTATYSDTPNPTTKDYAYADLTTAFSFDPTTSTALTSETSVSITLFGQTTSQAISVTARTITGVTLMGDMTNKSYCVGDEWDLTGLYLSIAWNIGEPNPTTVNLTDVDPSNYDLDEATPARGLTSLYIYGIYEGFDFEKTITGINVEKAPVADLLRTDSTSLNHSGSYDDVTGITKTGHSDIRSEATYAGHFMCATGSNSGALQFNPGSKSSYICTTASCQLLKSISLTFKNANSQSVCFYGSNTAYEAEYVSKATLDSSETSTLLGTLSASGSFNVTGNYKYLYIQTTGVTYVTSIAVTWKFAEEVVENSATTTQLSYRYESDGGSGFNFSNISIRFGGLINKALWNELDTTNDDSISGFGVMITAYDQGVEPSYSIKDHLENAVLAENTPNIDTKIINHYMQIGDGEGQMELPPAKSATEYYWNLFFSVDYSDINKYFTAAAYIKLGDEYVFFKQERYSVKSIAQDYIANRNCDDATAGGSLANLAA